MPQNLSYKSEFDLYEKQSVEGTHFHMNGFAHERLIIFDTVQRPKATHKWPIHEGNLVIIKPSYSLRTTASEIPNFCKTIFLCFIQKLLVPGLGGSD